jgi:hypothetical protein
MTVKSQVYDHPAYQAVLPLPSGNLTGNNGVGTKYAAFTAMQIKSITIAATVLTTTADVINLVRITGTGGTNTTTTTNIYGTMGSGAYFGNFTPAAASSQISLNQGDQFWVQKGADATGTYVGMIESVIVPLSNLTA